MKKRKTVIINPAFYNKNKPEKNLVYVNNTGNLLFCEAMHEQLDYQEEVWLGDDTFDLQGDVSAVIPSSNFIRHGGEILQYCIDFMEKTDCAVTMAGLGAQSSTTIKTPKGVVGVLPPYKVKCLKMMSERAVSLGVRGEFTAQCLEELGIHNYRIIGCPSLFRYLDGIFPRLKQASMDRPLITVTTRNSTETKIVELGRQLNAKWIMQMNTEFPETAFDGKELDTQSLEKTFPGLRLSKDELAEYMKKNAKAFDSFGEWLTYLKESNLTFSFGSRFHGNMCALLAGIPALWITHDSRTEELVKTLHLPNISREIFDGIDKPEQLLEYCDYEELYKEYLAMTSEYVAFLEENKLSHLFRC